MSTPRQIVAEQLAADQPDWNVLPYAFQPSNVELGHPVVTVFRSEVEPGSTVMVLDHKVTIFAFGSGTKGDKAEDEMDDILDGVLLSLERIGGFTVQSAKRGDFYNQTLSGWHIETTMTSTNVYRDIVLREKERNA